MDVKSSELDRLRADMAKADAQRDQARKQVKQLQAELDLVKADPDAGPKAAAEAQLAILKARRAQAEATAAAINAEAEAAKAKIGSVTGTALGTTTADTGAGALEAGLLTAEAIDNAAALIAARLASLNAKRYVLFTGTQRPNFNDYRLFQARIAAIADAYRHADAARNDADAMGAAGEAESKSAMIADPAAVGVAAAAASLELISKFGSYLMSDYKFSPAAVSGVDADLLAVSLAGLLTDCLYPARWSPAPDDTEAFRLLQPLTSRWDKARPRLRAVIDAQKQASAAAASTSEAARKERLKALADQYQRAADIYIGAGKAVDDLLTSLTEADNTGVARVTRIAEQKAISDYLADDGLALILQISGGAATTYTQKSLWTFFRPAPFYVSGGIIASFLAVDRAGSVKAAGQERLHSGFLRIQSVADRLTAAAEHKDN